MDKWSFPGSPDVYAHGLIAGYFGCAQLEQSCEVLLQLDSFSLLFSLPNDLSRLPKIES